MMLQLGRYQFSLSTAAYQRLRRSSSWRWEEKARIGRRPALQHTGPGADTITLEGTVYPHFRGGLGQVAAMRDEAGQGEPLRLVDGQGHILGLWCILTLEETQEQFLQGGSPRKQTFTLSIKQYGEDQVA